MTVTFVGVGTTATGNNAAITPGVPAGVAVGDLVFIHASIRAAAGVVVAPAGWKLVFNTTRNEGLLGRFWQAGDVMPAVSFTGGAAGDDTIAQSSAFRGAAPEVLDGYGSGNVTTNVSAQNIAYPALAGSDINRLMVMYLWKQSTSTSIATPAGWTSLGFTSATVTGATMQWYYRIDTSATAITAGSAVVTGGAAAVSKGAIHQFRSASQLTASVIGSAYPTRVTLAATGLDANSVYTIYRVVAGVRTAVRGALQIIGSPSFVVVDAELPFGVPVTYVLARIGDDSTVMATTYTLAGGKVAVTDAIQASAAEVVILAWNSQNLDAQASVFSVDGKNIVVTSGLGQATTSIQLYCETTAGNNQLEAVLKTATGGIVQIRQPGGYDDVDGYYNLLSVTKDRFSQDGSDQRRTWTLNVAEVDGWASSLLDRGFTYANLDAKYVGLTYAQWKVDYPNYLAAALGDYS